MVLLRIEALDLSGVDPAHMCGLTVGDRHPDVSVNGNVDGLAVYEIQSHGDDTVRERAEEPRLALGDRVALLEREEPPIDRIGCGVTATDAALRQEAQMISTGHQIEGRLTRVHSPGQLRFRAIPLNEPSPSGDEGSIRKGI
jgi:hypothetical protein